MLCTRRLPAVRLCLLIAGVVLLSATFVALPASADPARAVAASRSHEAVSTAHPSKRRARRSRSAAARRARCAAMAREGKHRKGGKACVRRKHPVSPSTALTGAEAPAEAPEEPGSEAGSSPESPGESGSPPVEPTPPVKPISPVVPTTPATPGGPFRFFSPSSFWNEELSAGAALDPSSAGVVTAFDQEIAAAEAAKKGEPFINTTAWSVPIYTVPADQPTVKVTLIASRLSLSPALQSAWEAVPLPAGAQPAVGTDKVLVVWQPSTGKLWEFWQLEETLTGWQAAWGGAMQNAPAESGAYGPEDWAGAKSNWGAAATSLSMAGGLITLEDLEKGRINHALAMSIPTPRGGVYASPAERTDGWSTEPLSIPEGAHLRLDPSLDLASLHLPHVTLMMAEAAQRYGIFVANQSANVAMYAQDPIPTGTNPYSGPHGYYEGKSAQQILEAFPWSHLQLLKMELHNES